MKGRYSSRALWGGRQRDGIAMVQTKIHDFDHETLGSHSIRPNDDRSIGQAILIEFMTELVERNLPIPKKNGGNRVGRDRYN
jgi:hypothetical protein